MACCDELLLFKKSLWSSSILPSHEGFRTGVCYTAYTQSGTLLGRGVVDGRDPSFSAQNSPLPGLLFPSKGFKSTHAHILCHLSLSSFAKAVDALLLQVIHLKSSAPNSYNWWGFLFEKIAFILTLFFRLPDP